jgi:hypothetical protein
LTAQQIITTGKKLELHNKSTSRKAPRNQKMREMKANLMATLILGDGMEMDYFANVSEENASSILRVNPKDAGSMGLQNARNISYCTWYRKQKSTTKLSSKLRTQCF